MLGVGGDLGDMGGSLLYVLIENTLPLCSEPSEIGENPRSCRLTVLAEDKVRGEGEGEGDQRSESPEPCSSSSPEKIKGSSFGRFTVNSTLKTTTG